MLTIGLTGGLGSGKSTIAQEFQKLGITVIDTDHLAHEVTKQPAVLQKIQQRFENILLADGSLDRAKLRGIIFKNPEDRHWLEALLHPLIWDLAEQQVKISTSSYCVIMIPLLVETEAQKRLDRILVVDVPIETQIQRVQTSRGWPLTQIQAIIQSQATREQRLSVAHDAIDNTGPRSLLAAKVKTLHQHYLDLTVL